MQEFMSIHSCFVNGGDENTIVVLPHFSRHSYCLRPMVSECVIASALKFTIRDFGHIGEEKTTCWMSTACKCSQLTLTCEAQGVCFYVAKRPASFARFHRQSQAG